MGKGGITSCCISLSHAELAHPKGKANQSHHGMVESNRFIREEEQSKENSSHRKEKTFDFSTHHPSQSC